MNYENQNTRPFRLKETSITCSGFCKRCQTVHTVAIGKAKIAAIELIKILDREKRIDFHLPEEKSDSRFSTDYLFGKARGKMLGTMVCTRADGKLITLKAFSGQYNGEWLIEGWVPPLFNLNRWRAVNDPCERDIKDIGVNIDMLESRGIERTRLIKMRQHKSRELMKSLHNLYVLHNFRGQCRPLYNVYTGDNGIPNGTGDCCGPKLLNFAAANNLQPIGIAEFYYGKNNKIGDRMHGHFYSSCREKCAPILGYLLCGLDKNDGHRIPG